MRNIIRILMVLMLLGAFACGAAAAEGNGYVQTGERAPEFTATLTDSSTVRLSELLKEKEAVVLNFWASWCNPCQLEFPYMQESYLKHKDEIAIVALSVEPNDTADAIEKFKKELGLSDLPMGQDLTNVQNSYYTGTIPTTVIIDRYGVVCFQHNSAILATETFDRLFETFLGDDYTESVLLDGVPTAVPGDDVKSASAEELAAALNVNGGAMAFSNGKLAWEWPMIAVEEDGRSCVLAVNSPEGKTNAILQTKLEAKAGDVLAFSFKAEGTAGFDVFSVCVNGENVKSFTGSTGWRTYAYSFAEDGTYDVTFRYENIMAFSDGVGKLWIDDVALLGGNEAKAVLSANPVYPTAEETEVVIKNKNARPIVFDNLPLQIAQAYDGIRFYLLSGEEAELEITIAKDVDPEMLVLFTGAEYGYTTVAQCLNNGRFSATAALNSAETTGEADTMFSLFERVDDPGDVACTVVFSSEAYLDAFAEALNQYVFEGDTVTWRYADVEKAVGLPTGYRIFCTDEDGNPVEGVNVQICDDEQCNVLTTDASGAVSCDMPLGAYEVHVLTVPEGYARNDEVYILSESGGALTIILKKE